MDKAGLSLVLVLAWIQTRLVSPDPGVGSFLKLSYQLGPGVGSFLKLSYQLGPGVGSFLKLSSQLGPGIFLNMYKARITSSLSLPGRYWAKVGIALSHASLVVSFNN